MFTYSGSLFGRFHAQHIQDGRRIEDYKNGTEVYDSNYIYIYIFFFKSSKYIYIIRKLQHYLIWTSVGLLDFLTKEDFEIVADVFKNYDHWGDCVSKTIDVMGYAVGSMLARKGRFYQSKNLVESMFDAVKEELKNNLNNIDWLDDETRLAVVEKADAMIHTIGNNCLKPFHFATAIS